MNLPTTLAGLGEKLEFLIYNNFRTQMNMISIRFSVPAISYSKEIETFEKNSWVNKHIPDLEMSLLGIRDRSYYIIYGEKKLVQVFFYSLYFKPILFSWKEIFLNSEQHTYKHNLPDDKGSPSPAILSEHLMCIFSGTKVYSVILGIRWCYFVFWVP